MDIKAWTPLGQILHHVQDSNSGGFEQDAVETGTSDAWIC